MRHIVLFLIFSCFFNFKCNSAYSKNKQFFFSNSFFSFEQNSNAKLIYKDGFLSIEGLNGNANVTIYSIIGNKVAFFSNTELRKFNEFVSLQKETMYITRIEFSNAVFTYKFFTR